MACAVARRRQGKETNEKRTARNNYCSSMREGKEEEEKEGFPRRWMGKRGKRAKEGERERDIYRRKVIVVHRMEEERIKEARSR